MNKEKKQILKKEELKCDFDGESSLGGQIEKKVSRELSTNIRLPKKYYPVMVDKCYFPLIIGNFNRKYLLL